MSAASADVFFSSNLLAEPRSAEQALRRAKSHANEGAHRLALELIESHIGSTSGPLLRQFLELRVRCTWLIGGRWRPLLDAALRHYDMAHDNLGVGRLQGLHGEALLAAGKLGEAETLLLQARQRAPRPWPWVEHLLAQLTLRQGFVARALPQLDAALRLAEAEQQPRCVGLIRLDRAFALACLGQPATQEILQAHRLLSAVGTAADNLSVQLRNAECLLASNAPARAKAGLRGALLHACEEPAVGARLRRLLGEDNLGTNAARAQEYLTLARATFEQLGHRQDVAHCDVLLCRATGGLHHLQRWFANWSHQDWPLLEAQANLVRLQLGDPAASKLHAAVLRFALQSGHVLLQRQLEGITPQAEASAPADEETHCVVALSPILVRSE